MQRKIFGLVQAIATDPTKRKRALWAAITLTVLGVLAFDSFPASRPVQQNLSWSAGPSGEPKVSLTGAQKSISPGGIWVAVSGAVRHPGVYRLNPGDRVFSLVFLAGGLSPSADQVSVNLARILADGEQVIVGSKTQTVNAQNSSNPPQGSDGGGKVNVNTADESGLEQLPGIGPTLGKRIADYRAKHGTFKSKADLLNVPGIGSKLVAGMSDFLVY